MNTTFVCQILTFVLTSSLGHAADYKAYRPEPNELSPTCETMLPYEQIRDNIAGLISQNGILEISIDANKDTFLYARERKNLGTANEERYEYSYLQILMNNTVKQELLDELLKSPHDSANISFFSSNGFCAQYWQRPAALQTLKQLLAQKRQDRVIIFTTKTYDKGADYLQISWHPRVQQTLDLPKSDANKPESIDLPCAVAEPGVKKSSSTFVFMGNAFEIISDESDPSMFSDVMPPDIAVGYKENR